MSTLVLIPCSGRKKPAEVFNNDLTHHNNSIINLLDEENANRLIDYRSILANNRFDLNGPTLSAYIGYDGHLFKEVNAGAWEILNQRDDILLIIVSALYGLLLYKEPIIRYDLAMTDKADRNETMTVKRFWRTNNLIHILNNFINKNDVTVVNSLLFKKYRDVLNRFIGINVQHFNDITQEHNLTGYGHQHGMWLNNFLLNL